MEKGYSCPRWMTYKQAIELGHVRKGEHGSLIVYADQITKTEENVSGEAVERDIPFMKGYTVFNVAQIEGLPEEYYGSRRRKASRCSSSTKPSGSLRPRVPSSVTAAAGLGEVHALEQLHRNVGGSFGFAQLVDRHDVGVMETSRGPGPRAGSAPPSRGFEGFLPRAS